MQEGGMITFNPVEFKKNYQELKATCQKLTLAIDQLLNEQITESDEINKIADFAQKENDKAKRLLQTLSL